MPDLKTLPLPVVGGPLVRGNEPEEVTMYRCPVCRQLHDYSDDASECCAPVSTHAEESTTECPVCGAAHQDTESAAHCCLWKSMTHFYRLRVAQLVSDGETWSEAISAMPKVH